MCYCRSARGSMSRLEHVVQVGAAIKRAAPTPTAVPPPPAAPPLRWLPDDVAQVVLAQVFENTPLEDVCGRVYERCLLFKGSGRCPPDDPVWRTACQRLGLTPLAGFGPMGTSGAWQQTFYTFCRELSQLSTYLRDMVWMCLRGNADLVSFTDRTSAQEEWRDSKMGPMVSQLLQRSAIFDDFIEHEAAAQGNLPLLIQQLDGRPSRALSAMMEAIDDAGYDPGSAPAVQLYLDAGLNVNSRVGPDETLLQHAIRYNAVEAVRMFLRAGADMTVRDSIGYSVDEQARAELFRLIADEVNGKWDAENWRIPNALEIWTLFDPTAGANWLFMGAEERQRVALLGSHALFWTRQTEDVYGTNSTDAMRAFAEEAVEEAAAALAQYGL